MLSNRRDELPTDGQMVSGGECHHVEEQGKTREGRVIEVLFCKSGEGRARVTFKHMRGSHIDL